MNKDFWKATGIRCLRTFLTTILGCWTAGQMITEVDWKETLIAAASSTMYIFILCVLAGIPEVPSCHEMTDAEAQAWIERDPELQSELEEYEDGDEDE